MTKRFAVRAAMLKRQAVAWSRLAACVTNLSCAAVAPSRLAKALRRDPSRDHFFAQSFRTAATPLFPVRGCGCQPRYFPESSSTCSKRGRGETGYQKANASGDGSRGREQAAIIGRINGADRWYRHRTASRRGRGAQPEDHRTRTPGSLMPSARRRRRARSPPPQLSSSPSMPRTAL
jgi:hypothetical protein